MREQKDYFSSNKSKIVLHFSAECLSQWLMVDVIVGGYSSSDERRQNEMVEVDEKVEWVIIEQNRVQVVGHGGDDAGAAKDDNVDRVRTEIGNRLTFDDDTLEVGQRCHMRSQNF
jgi:hypothetical protein